MDARKLVIDFNAYFKKNIRCGKPCTSLILMDSNAYVLSLEFAVPQMFEPNFKYAKDKTKILKEDYKKIIDSFDLMEKRLGFQWEDIGYALLQIKQYNNGYYTEYKENIFNKLQRLNRVLDKIYFKNITKQTDTLDIKTESPTTEYSREVKGIDTADLAKIGMSVVMTSHVFATEAYHSRGALRIIVVTMEMKRKFMIILLTLNDYWGAMLENWGYLLKGLFRCIKRIQECFTDSSQHMWRFFTCLKYIRNALVNNRKRITKKTVHELINVDGNKFSALTYSSDLLFMFKKKNRIPDEKYESVKLKKGIRKYEDDFKTFFKCETLQKCISVMHGMVNSYNDALCEEYDDVEGRTIIYDRGNEEFYRYVTTVAAYYKKKNGGNREGVEYQTFNQTIGTPISGIL